MTQEIFKFQMSTSTFADARFSPFGCGFAFAFGVGAQRLKSGVISSKILIRSGGKPGPRGIKIWNL